jgi:hypothetical protein
MAAHVPTDHRKKLSRISLLGHLFMIATLSEVHKLSIPIELSELTKDAAQ